MRSGRMRWKDRFQGFKVKIETVQFGLRARAIETEIPSLRLKNGSAQDDPRYLTTNRTATRN
jgi:hypothetical protein